MRMRPWIHNRAWDRDRDLDLGLGVEGECECKCLFGVISEAVVKDGAVISVPIIGLVLAVGLRVVTFAGSSDSWRALKERTEEDRSVDG